MDFSEDGCCKKPSFSDVKSGLTTVGNDAKGAIAGAVDTAHTIGGEIENALGQLLDASLSVGVNGNFNLSLVDPNGNDTLTAEQILSMINGPNGLLGLLRVSGGLGADLKAKADVFGVTIGPLDASVQLLQFPASETAGADLTSETVPFAEIDQGTLHVFGTAGSDQIAISQDPSTGNIIATLGGTSLSFAQGSFSGIEVDLDGSFTPTSTRSHHGEWRQRFRHHFTKPAVIPRRHRAGRLGK